MDTIISVADDTTTSQGMMTSTTGTSNTTISVADDTTTSQGMMASTTGTSNFNRCFLFFQVNIELSVTVTSSTDIIQSTDSSYSATSTITTSVYHQSKSMLFSFTVNYSTIDKR